MTSEQTPKSAIAQNHVDPELPVKQQDTYLRLRKRVKKALNRQNRLAVLSGKAARRIGIKNSRIYAGKAAEVIALAPDIFHLMCKLTLDKRVPAKEKAKLGFAIAYFISPIDFIPVALTGPIGFIDDLAIAAYVLNSLLNKVDAEIVQEHWAGDGDILDAIKQITQWIDNILSSSILEKLRHWVDREANEKTLTKSTNKDDDIQIVSEQ